MASLVQRGNKFAVVYLYFDLTGKRKQKWESYDTYDEALNRKVELEKLQPKSRVSMPRCKTLNDLLDEYIAIYGKSQWSLSSYSRNTRMIDKYIKPFIGEMPLKKITVHALEKYYNNLLSMEVSRVGWSVSKNAHNETKFVSPSTVQMIHKILQTSGISVSTMNMTERM